MGVALVYSGDGKYLAGVLKLNISGGDMNFIWMVGNSRFCWMGRYDSCTIPLFMESIICHTKGKSSAPPPQGQREFEQIKKHGMDLLENWKPEEYLFLQDLVGFFLFSCHIWFFQPNVRGVFWIMPARRAKRNQRLSLTLLTLQMISCDVTLAPLVGQGLKAFRVPVRSAPGSDPQFCLRRSALELILKSLLAPTPFLPLELRAPALFLNRSALQDPPGPSTRPQKRKNRR